MQSGNPTAIHGYHTERAAHINAVQTSVGVCIRVRRRQSVSPCKRTREPGYVWPLCISGHFPSRTCDVNYFHHLYSDICLYSDLCMHSKLQSSVGRQFYDPDCRRLLRDITREPPISSIYTHAFSSHSAYIHSNKRNPREKKLLPNLTLCVGVSRPGLCHSATHLPPPTSSQQFGTHPSNRTLFNPRPL